MNCTKHPDREAAGICSHSGKPFCAEELVDIEGRLVAKDSLSAYISSLKELAAKTSNPNSMVFMNAGGGGGASSSAAAAPIAQNITAPVPSVAIPVGGKSRSTAGILALLLGGIGAHKFYLGKWIQGLLYLCFVWTFIPSVIAAIEGIRYLTMSDAEFALKFG